jgi:hypothetical protein
MALSIESSAFRNGEEIPTVYTCLGQNVSPPLTWSGLPEKTRSLALIVDDPDAPDPNAPKTTWVHWVLYGLSPSVNGLPQGAGKRAPPGARDGVNDSGQTGYDGPCPPIGRHRYFFKLYALDAELPDLDGPTKQRLEKAMQGHVLAEAELVGTYQQAK